LIAVAAPIESYQCCRTDDCEARGRLSMLQISEASSCRNGYEAHLCKNFAGFYRRRHQIQEKILGSDSSHAGRALKSNFSLQREHAGRIIRCRIGV